LRFGWAFSPRAHVDPPRGPFPAHAAFGSHVPDTVLDAALVPAAEAAVQVGERVRRLQRDKVQGQAFLIGLALLGLLAWWFIWW
jgi:hydrogenase-4 component B